MLALVVRFQFGALQSELGLFCVRLRVNRRIFARGHGHGAGEEDRDSRYKHVAVSGVRSSNTNYQA